LIGRRAFTPGLVTAALAGCAPNRLIRTETAAPCRAAAEAPPGVCGTAALEERNVTLTGGPGLPLTDSYIAGFVEFDDEGKLFEPQQEEVLLRRMVQEAASQDLCIVVFVHGWKHSVKPDDTNVVDFHNLLELLAKAEMQLPAVIRRKVVGIYVGWRGLSADATFIDRNLSFWARKNAAHRVSEGSVRSLLGKVKALRDLVNTQPGRAAGREHRSTRMITIGHSFGGLIVYSALAQYFIDRAAASEMRARFFQQAAATDHPQEKADPREISGYGDIVLIINPAIEAMRYEPIRQLMDEQRVSSLGPRRFARFQNPIFIEATSRGTGPSDGDWATGFVFPLGRFLNTMFESTRTDPRTGESERQQILTALGHYGPFWTHEMTTSRRDLPRPQRLGAEVPAPDMRNQCRQLRAFEAEFRQDGYLRPGWRREYLGGAILTHTAVGRFDPNSPFWIIKVSPEIILDHNDIAAPVFVGFVQQLYNDLDRIKDPSLCERFDL
jgi:hypothetical protein